MADSPITGRDRRWARLCIACKLCKYARARQRGLAHWLVRKVERRLCPFCKAHRKVYGKDAHEPLPQEKSGPP